MSEWPRLGLGELAAKRRGAIAIGPFGSAMKADTYTVEGVPVIRGTNISDTRAWKGDWVYISETFADGMPRCAVEANELVFPHRGSIGEVAIIPRDGFKRYFLSSSLMKIQLDVRKVVPLFVYYYFRSPLGRAEILKYGSQVGTPGIGQPLESLRRFAVPVPPIDVQNQVALLLGALDDKIDANRRMNEALGAMARAIFKDWFIDFGPVRAKAEGRQPPGLATDIAALFPDALNDEDKPVGWLTSTIGDEVRVVGGTTPATSEPLFWDGEIAWATPKDLSALRAPVLWQTERRISSAGLAQIGSGLLPEGTVLLSSRAPIGYLAIAQIPVSVNQGFIAMVCEKKLSNTFCWLWTEANMEAIKQRANGSTFMEISKTNFRPIIVIVPPPAVAAAFEGIARPLVSRIAANEQESRTLASLRDVLLPKLMSGEIRFRNTEKAMEATA